MGDEEDAARFASDLRRFMKNQPETPIGWEPGRERAHPISRSPDPAQAAPKPKWSVEPGHIGIMFTIVMALSGLIWHQSASQTQLLEAQSQARRDIDSLLARGAIYGPRVESLDQSNQVQNERIQNLAVALQDQRKISADILTILGNIREDMATVRSRLNLDKRTELTPPSKIPFRP